MNKVSPEQLTRRENNYQAEQPKQPTQPTQLTQPTTNNNYQPLSSFSSTIEPVQESIKQPITKEVNALPTQPTQAQISTSAMPQIDNENAFVSRIPPPKTAENMINSSVDNQIKQDNQYDNLYDLLNNLILD